MESRVKLFGHPVHPMLIVYPLGLLSMAVIFDILYLIFNNRLLPTASYYMIAAGVLGGLLAAIFGFIDWLALPNQLTRQEYRSLAWTRQRSDRGAVCGKLVPARRQRRFRPGQPGTDPVICRRCPGAGDRLDRR